MLCLQSIEATVDMKCVTNGSLKIPRRQFKLESGQMKFSLRMKDSVWEPRQGLESWDATWRTFAKVSCSRRTQKIKLFLLYSAKEFNLLNCFEGKGAFGRIRTGLLPQV